MDRGQIFDNALREAGVNIDSSTEEFGKSFTDALQRISPGLAIKFNVEWENKDRIVLFNTSTCDTKENPIVLLHCNILEHFKEQFINGADGSYKYMDRTPPFIRDQTAYESDDEYTSYVKSYIERDDMYFDKKLDFPFENYDNGALGVTENIQGQLDERYWQWFFSDANVNKSHQQELTRLRDEHQRNIEALEDQCNAWLQQEKEKIDAAHKTELDELETLHQNNMVELQNKYDEKLQNELQQVQAIHQQTIEMLQQEKTTILQEIEELRIEHGRIIDEMKQQHKLELQNEQDKFENQRQQETEELRNKHYKRIDELQDQYKTRLEENKKNAEADLARATKNWQQKESEFTMQNKKANDTYQKAFDDWRRKEGQFNQKIRELEQELISIKETQLRRDKFNLQLEKKLKDEESKNRSLTRENDNYKLKLDELSQADVENREKYIEDIKQNNILINQQGELIIKITNLEQANQEQLKLNDEMKQEITILKQEKEKLVKNTQKLLEVERKNVSDISQEVEDLKLQLKQSQDINLNQSEAIQEKDRMLFAQQQVNERKKKEFSERDADRDQFIENLEDKIKRLSEEKKTNEDLINATNEKNQKLAQELEKIRAQNVDILEKNKNILEKQEISTNQISQLGLEKQELESRFQELTQQYSAQAGQIIVLSDASTKLNEENGALNQKNEQLQKELDKLKENTDKLSAKILDLQESNVANSTSVEKLKENYRQSLKEKNNEIDSKENTLSELQIELEEKKKRLLELEKELLLLKQNLTQQQTENNNLNASSTKNKELADEYKSKNDALETEVNSYKLKDTTLQLENTKKELELQLKQSEVTYHISDDLTKFEEDSLPFPSKSIRIGKKAIKTLQDHLDTYRQLVLVTTDKGVQNEQLIYKVTKLLNWKFVYYDTLSIPTKSKIKLGKMLSLGDVITRNYYKQIATETSTGNYMISINFYQDKQRTHALQIKNVQARAIGVDSRHELVCHFSANKSLIGYAMIGPMGSDIVARQGLLIMRIANEHGAVRTARYFYNVAIPETSPKFGVPCLTQLDGNDKLFVTYCSPSYIKLETLVVGLSSTI
jgi:hypothetical protein